MMLELETRNSAVRHPDSTLHFQCFLVERALQITKLSWAPACGCGLDVPMALSEKQSEQILVDLVQHIQEQGGTISSEKFMLFYAKFPQHHGLVKNFRSFCEKHPDRIAINSGPGCHYCLTIPTLKDGKVLALLHEFVQKRNGTVTVADLEAFSLKQPACGKAIHAGGHMARIHFFFLQRYLRRKCCVFLSNDAFERTKPYSVPAAAQGRLHSDSRQSGHSNQGAISQDS